MKLPIFTATVLASGLAIASLQATPQTLDVEPGDPGEYVVSWDGIAGRTYFIQYALTLADPTDWSYFPVIESGAGSELEWGFSSTEPELYLRLVYTDVVVADPFVADFDGDGVTSEDELNLINTDPFKFDTDGDGIDDGSQDFDGDGLTDIEEMNIGTNPLIDDVADVTDDDPQPEPPGTYQLVVTGTGDQPVNNTRTINTPVNGPSKYLVVVAVDSDEFPEWTRDQSEYNDKVTWKVEVDVVPWQSGNTEVNPLHQDWLDGIAEGRSFRGYQPTSFVFVDILELTPLPNGGQPSVEVFFDLTVENIGDDQYPTTAIMALIPLELEPEDGMIGVLGDEVESNQGTSGERHFVSTKKNDDLDDDFLKFEMKNIPSEDFDAFLQFDGDGEADPADTRKRRVSRAAAGKNTFVVELQPDFGGEEIDNMNAWIVWSDVKINPDFPLGGPDIIQSGVTPSGTKFEQKGFIAYVADWEPASIFDEQQDVPLFNGVVHVPPAAPPGSPELAFGAAERFDISRQVDVVVNDVTQVVQNADSEWASLAAKDFPGDPGVGNDDGDTANETGPYVAPITQSKDLDRPLYRVPVNIGAVGDKVSMDWKFREFTRINIGDEWYLSSDHLEVTMKVRMLRAQGANGLEWQDDGADVIMTP